MTDRLDAASCSIGPLLRARCPRAWTAAPARDRARGAVGLAHNRFRAALSMLGISWGIVSVVVLLAYGNGFHGALDARVRAARSATASVIVWPGQTSMQAGGERAGKRVRVTARRRARRSRELPLVKTVSPEFMQQFPSRTATSSRATWFAASRPRTATMRSESPAPAGGRFLDDEDVRLHRRVAFIGTEVQRKLFGDSQPVGQTIRIGGLAVRSDRRHEGEGAAVELQPAGQVVRLHPLDRRSGQLLDSRGATCRLAGRRPMLEPKADDAGARVARPSATASTRPTSARCAHSARPRQQKITAASSTGLKLVLDVHRRADAGDRRRRHHEHHVREGAGAHARDRRSARRSAPGGAHILLQFLLEGLVTTFAGGVVGVAAVVRAGLAVQPAAVPLRAARRHDHGSSTSTWCCRPSCSLVCIGDPDAGRSGQRAAARRFAASRLDPIEALRYE